MQFQYKARTGEGEGTEGVIEAASLDLAVVSLQRRNFLVISIEPTEVAAKSVWNIAGWSSIFERRSILERSSFICPCCLE